MKNRDKTNAMRLLDQIKIPYKVHFYENDGFMDGVSVASKLGIPEEQVYKTLVVQGKSKEYFVCVIPVMDELDLKKTAKVLAEKSVEMIPAKDINKITGYVRGGCSPIGMKKKYVTVIDQTALEKKDIYVSGGRLGAQIFINSSILVNLTKAIVQDVTVSC
ncbi:MAG: Cys-tRNA(Pro) deacylase [Dethiosulfatibacter sp.]|nr:Cys-tRNA(Pro) deacylase [Dethiosulfatibacter sp.]